MSDPATLTVSAIATLAFQAFLKSSVGELSKKFTQDAIHKISQLNALISNKLKGNPDASRAILSVKDGAEEDLNDVVTYLKSAIRNDENFAAQVQFLAKEIEAGKLIDQSSMTQNVNDQGTGIQAKPEGESTQYVAKEIHFHGNDRN